ncbi:MAG: hypothetical protein O3A00_28035 [Planctomycetota bacterium]|nr:hypothetical protein [Planctomycetota bacterium]
MPQFVRDGRRFFAVAWKVEAENADLVRWIDDGAVWPGDSKPPAKIDSQSSQVEIAHSNHWSLQPRHVVEPPDVSRARWQGSAIDRFLEAKREAA